MAVLLEVGASHALSYSFSSTLKQDGALLAAVRRRRCETARHGCKTPFLNVGFNEHKAHLAEVDVNLTRARGADGGEEVLRFKPVGDIFELFAVAGEKYGASAGTVANADDIALEELRAVRRRDEGLIVATGAIRTVRY